METCSVCGDGYEGAGDGYVALAAEEWCADSSNVCPQCQGNLKLALADLGFVVFEEDD